MIKRTTKMVHAKTNEVIYNSTCTIDGNAITGCQNPFPYMQRKMKKLGLRPVKMLEEGHNITLFVV